MTEAQQLKQLADCVSDWRLTQVRLVPPYEPLGAADPPAATLDLPFYYVVD